MGKRTGKPRGRPKGSPNKATAAKAAEIAASGLTPLDYMLAVMRDANQPREIRMEAAKAAAQYVHPRLSAVEHSGEVTHRRVNELSDAELAAIASGSRAGASDAPDGPPEPAGVH